MAFYGYQFVFNGISSWEYGLMIYDLSGSKEDGVFASAPSAIFEDRTAWRNTPIYYGVSKNKPLTFTLTFGALPENRKPWLSRWEMDAIASWLTGEEGYKYLEIMQPDMEAFRYKCMITDMKYTTYGKYPWAFSCEVQCDSPYAYLYPETISQSVAGQATRDFNNRASSKYYRPKMEITLYAKSEFRIINHSDQDREFVFNAITGTYPLVITVDNENEIITNNRGLNLYDSFNFHFFRLVRGKNELEYRATNASVKYLCEFPINVGG